MDVRQCLQICVEALPISHRDWHTSSSSLSMDTLQVCISIAHCLNFLFFCDEHSQLLLLGVLGLSSVYVSIARVHSLLASLRLLPCCDVISLYHSDCCIAVCSCLVWTNGFAYVCWPVHIAQANCLYNYISHCTGDSSMMRQD